MNIKALLAENERLRAELKRTKAELERVKFGTHYLYGWITQLDVNTDLYEYGAWGDQFIRRPMYMSSLVTVQLNDRKTQTFDPRLMQAKALKFTIELDNEE